MFVELYLKNRQLLEQAEMLRGQLAESARPDVVRELVARLGSVEDQLDLVTSQAKEGVDPAMGGHLGELVDRVATLRAGIEALRAGP